MFKMTRRFIKLTIIELKLFFRAPIATFFTFIFPLLYLLLVMEVLVEQKEIAVLINKNEFLNLHVINYVIPSLIILIIATTSIMGIPSLLVNYREISYFKRLIATTLTPFTILTSLMTAYLIITFIGITLVIIAGKVFYQAQFEGKVFLFFAGLMISFISLSSLGFVIASLCRTIRTAVAVSYIVFFPMLLFSGILLSFQKIPGWLSFSGAFVPATYGVNLLNGLWFGEPFVALLNEILILIGIFLCGGFISIRTFHWEL